MLKKIIKILSLILSISLVIGLITYINHNNNSKANDSGSITIIVNDIDNNMVSKKNISYDINDTIFDIVDNNYNLYYNVTTLGHFLLGISDNDFCISTDGYSSWIWLELCYLKDGTEYSYDLDISNYDVYDSNVGIDSIELVNNMILVINQRDNLHNTTILNINNSNTTSNNRNIFKIILYLLVIIFLIVIIIYLLFNKSKNKITVRQLCILSFMTVILFVQEELLSFIPNIQLTFLLMAIYTCVFGLKYTYMIIFVHVILDNMIMGSLTPVVMIPMFIGYLIYCLLIYLVRNKNLFFKILFGVIGSLIYCYIFLLVNVFILDVNFNTYLILDIPFELLLVLSTIITILYLFKPIEKFLKYEWNRK